METTWIFIIIGILILFFLLTNTIIIHMYSIQTPPREKGELVYKNDLPTQTYVVTKSSDLPVKKSEANTNTNTNTMANTNMDNIVNVPIPIPYVTQNVANTCPYPPVSLSTSSSTSLSTK
jgi:hypothetical protein